LIFTQANALKLYNALAAVNAAVLYAKYSTRSTFELPTQSGTFVSYIMGTCVFSDIYTLA